MRGRCRWRGRREITHSHRHTQDTDAHRCINSQKPTTTKSTHRLAAQAVRLRNSPAKHVKERTLRRIFIFVATAVAVAARPPNHRG